MRDEPGVAHNRAAVGISTRGRDTGDAQLFINLIDSPRLDHAYTVFAVVERGMDVADARARGRRDGDGRTRGRSRPVTMRSSRAAGRPHAEPADRGGGARARERPRAGRPHPSRIPHAPAIAYPSDLLAPLADPAGLTYDPRTLRAGVGARDAVVADYARRGVAVTRRSRVPHGQHQRGLCAALQAALRSRRRGAGAAAELSALRAPDGARVRARRRPTSSSCTGTGASTSTALARRSTSAPAPCWSCRPTTRPARSSDRAELDALADVCAAHGLALIGDEVFADYRLDGEPPAPIGDSAARDALAVSLGGLSKSVGLPQVKVAWMAVGGPADAAARGAGRARGHRRHVPVGVDAGAGGAAGACSRDGAVVRDAIRARTRQKSRRARALPSRRRRP